MIRYRKTKKSKWVAFRPAAEITVGTVTVTKKSSERGPRLKPALPEVWLHREGLTRRGSPPQGENPLNPHEQIRHACSFDPA